MSEQAIKALQKEMLSTFEEELLYAMSPENFNALRKLVFRSTFLAYKLGYLGTERDTQSLGKLIDTAITHGTGLESCLQELDPETRRDLLEYCLEIWVDAMRIGTIAYVEKEAMSAVHD